MTEVEFQNQVCAKFPSIKWEFGIAIHHSGASYQAKAIVSTDKKTINLTLDPTIWWYSHFFIKGTDPSWTKTVGHGSTLDQAVSSASASVLR